MKVHKFIRSLVNDDLALLDGTELRRVPVPTPLYTARDGRVFYLYRNRLCERVVKTNRKNNYCKRCKTGNVQGQRYPYVIVQSKACYVHVLMALTWLGPRPIVVDPKGVAVRMEIDHLNGDILDWRAENLEWVTPEENRKRARLLRVLRSIGRDPKLIPYDELRAIMNHYEFVNPSKIN